MYRSIVARIVAGLILAALVFCPAAGTALAQETELQKSEAQAPEKQKAEAQEAEVQETDAQEAEAQEPEVQKPDPVLERAKKQYESFREKAKDLRTRSVMTTNAGGSTITTTTVSYRKGEKSRVETVVEVAAGAAPGAGRTAMEIAPSETIYIRDGKDTWLVSSGQPKRKLQDQEADMYGTADDWWSRIPDGAKITGEEQVGGRDCHIVRITLKKGATPVTAWLDKDNLVMVGGEGQYQGKWMRWIGSDFREIEGRQVPHRLDFFAGKDAAGSMIVESVDANARLSDDLFDPTKLLGEQDRQMEAARQQGQGWQ